MDLNPQTVWQSTVTLRDFQVDNLSYNHLQASSFVVFILYFAVSKVFTVWSDGLMPDLFTFMHKLD